MQPGNRGNAFGVDVSEFQGHPDWPRVYASGRRFAYVRATYGAALVDTSLATNWMGVRAANLYRGAYHFAVPGETSATVLTDAQTQAAAFLAAVDHVGGIQGDDLPPVLDLEENPHGLSPVELGQWAAHWLGCVDAAVKNAPQTAIVYSNYAFLQGLGAGVDAIKTRGLWIARWDPFGAPANVGPWTAWTCWQYSDKGSVPGITGAVDLDEWHTGLPVLSRPPDSLTVTVQTLTTQLAAAEKQHAADQATIDDLRQRVTAAQRDVQSAAKALSN